MKAVLLAFSVLFASVFAIPQPLDEKVLQNERLIDAVLESLIQDLINAIQDRGLDPYHLEYASGSYALPVPVIFSAWGKGENVQLTGLSNIVVNEITYGILTGRLNMDLSLPQVSGSVGNAEGTVTIFGNELAGQGNGALTISGVRLIAEARISIGISGVTVSSLKADFSVESLQSDINVVIQDRDLSEYFNTAFNDIIPKYFNAFNDEINELISHYALIIINNRL